MKPSFQNTFVSLTTNRIDDGITDFSFGPLPERLRQSIQAISITHPLSLMPLGRRYRVVCGNRRLQVARELKLMEVPARILPETLSEEDQLRLNLDENASQRAYSDLETGSILFRLTQWGVEENRLVDQYMSILGLARSKKLALDYLGAGKLQAGLAKQLHALNAPLRTFYVLFRWDEKSRAATEQFIAAIKPGVNKLRELLEWIDETARRDEISPYQIIGRDDIQSVLKDCEPSKRFDRVQAILLPLRYPSLSALRKEIWLALDHLKLDFKTKIRIDENFEKDEKLSQAARSEAINELIEIFQKLVNKS